jgi:hypothetical protein
MIGWAVATIAVCAVGALAGERQSVMKRAREIGKENLELRGAIKDTTSQMVERLEGVWRERDAIAREERRRYEAREKKWENQVQAMAERLATLKIRAAEQGIELKEDAVPFDADPPVPYDPELYAFLSAIEQDEAKQLTEQYIEQRRERGAADVQILSELEQGDYR